MELDKPVEDWELSCLAERMSPMEFEQIAMTHLGITKVKLDQSREDAGRNCITFMANSLTAWRDSAPRNKARQLLYSALTKAADHGLIERRSFMFLITGEENVEGVHIQETEWTAWIRQIRRTCKGCFSCTTCVLLMLSFLVLSGAGFLSLGIFAHASNNYDEITTRMKQKEVFIEPNEVQASEVLFEPKEVVTSIIVFVSAIGSCSLLIFISLIFEWHMCCSVTFVQGQRVQERNRDRLKLFLILAMAFCVYLPVACFGFYFSYSLRNYRAPKTDIAEWLRSSRSCSQDYCWDKIQIWLGCCGVDNYTFWEGKFPAHVVPDSCCKSFFYKPNCGHFTNLEEINSEGCLIKVTDHVSKQVHCHTEQVQILFLIEGTILFLGWLGMCIWAWNKRKGLARVRNEHAAENVNEREQVVEDNFDNDDDVPLIDENVQIENEANRDRPNQNTVIEIDDQEVIEVGEREQMENEGLETQNVVVHHIIERQEGGGEDLVQ